MVKRTSDSTEGVFPAHAGMSPMKAYRFQDKNRFPRPRGDEPNSRAATVATSTFSPPTRG